MIKINRGKPSLMASVYKDLQKPEPDWETAAQKLGEISRLMSMLTKQKPLRGSQEAWNGLVQDYLDKVKGAQTSVQEHRLQPARAWLEKLTATCDKCHDQHGIQ